MTWRPPSKRTVSVYGQRRVGVHTRAADDGVGCGTCGPAGGRPGVEGSAVTIGAIGSVADLVDEL